MVSVGYGGRPPWVLSTRGAMQSTSAASAEKVDVLFNLGQSIADTVNLFTVIFAGKKVIFDGATFLHGTGGSDVDGRSMLSQGYRRCEKGFSRSPSVLGYPPGRSSAAS